MLLDTKLPLDDGKRGFRAGTGQAVGARDADRPMVAGARVLLA